MGLTEHVMPPLGLIPADTRVIDIFFWVSKPAVAVPSPATPDANAHSSKATRLLGALYVMEGGACESQELQTDANLNARLGDIHWG